MSEPVVNLYLNAKQLQCPMPLLKAKQALNKMLAGEVLHIEATDAGSWRDIKAYTDMSAHVLLHAEDVDGVYSYWIKRG